MTDTQTATGQPHARHIAAGTGEGWWFFDSLMVIQADQPGQPVIVEATVAPGGGAPLHVHDDLDDSFYLVSGRLVRMNQAVQARPPIVQYVISSSPPSKSTAEKTSRSAAPSPNAPRSSYRPSMG